MNKAIVFLEDFFVALLFSRSDAEKLAVFLEKGCRVSAVGAGVVVGFYIGAESLKANPYKPSLLLASITAVVGGAVVAAGFNAACQSVSQEILNAIKRNMSHGGAVGARSLSPAERKLVTDEARRMLVMIGPSVSDNENWV